MPRSTPSSAADSSACSSSISFDESTCCSCLMDSPPDVEECASSTSTAKLRPTTSAASSATTGNFCNVVMMTRAACPDRASFSCAEFLSIRTIVPGVCSNPATVSCNCRSSTTRSVITTTLSNTGRF